MRIAVGGLHTECSTFNPVQMKEADFRILRGAALPDHPEFAPLHGYRATYLPTLHARAIAGGRIDARVYAAFKSEFRDRLAASLPLDGLYLAMHGAAYVDGMEDAEADWIESARAVVGPDCQIAASYDLHGNVSQRIVDTLDMFSAYRTAPHIDVAETKARALAMLTRAIAKGERPFLAWSPIPMLLPGERTSTEDQPARRLYAALPEIDRGPGVWDASLLVGYVWADEPRSTASAVLTGTDAAALKQAAASLAQSYWQARRQFHFDCGTGDIQACLDCARATTTRPVILADSGDNPTGGGVGDRADLLAVLLCRGEKDVLVAGIADREAVAACYAAGTGAEVALSVGGSLDRSSPKVAANGRVAFLLSVAEEPERQAVVVIAGVSVVLTARRRPFHNIADFTRLGLDPASVRLLVVKSGYLSPELAPLARPKLMAFSPGVVDQDVEHLPMRRITHPCFPFDAGFAWAPTPRLSRRAPR